MMNKKQKNNERAKLPLLLLSLLAEKPMHGYEINQQIEARSIRQWANVGLSSIYQTLEKMVEGGLLSAQEVVNEGQGASYRTVYSITTQGQEELLSRVRMALASTEHQRFDYDLGLGIALTHLPLHEVKEALEHRSATIQTQLQRASEACQWAEEMLGAWAVLEHQRRSLEAELAWLDTVINRIRKETTL